MTRRRGSKRLPRLPDESRLRLREPADVLGAIPYLLGYHPADSVVILALRGKQLAFTAREDLPEPGAGSPAVAEMVEHLLRAVLNHDVTGVLLAGFGPDASVRPVLIGLRTRYEQAGIEVRELLRADGGRYWSYLCDDPICCPPDGTPYDVGSSAVAAQATLAGQVVLPDRAAYEEQIKPVGGLSRLSMMQATVRADERLLDLLSGAPDEEAAMDALEQAGRQAVGRAIARQREGGRLDDDEVAWLTVLLASIPVRDIAWAAITGTREELEHHRALWMDLMRRAEPDLIPAPGGLFAFAAWRCGESALARLALGRVLDEDPTYNMAVLLYGSLARGLSPAVLADWPGPDLSPEQLSWRNLRPGSASRRRRRSSSRRAGSRRG
jgi:hypothetical protein